MLSSIFIPLPIDEEVVGRRAEEQRAEGQKGRGDGKAGVSSTKDNNAKRLRTHAKVTNE
jgi:hypothetical protein